MVVKFITGRGGGGGTGSEEASWGTSGPVRITGRGVVEHDSSSESGHAQSLKRIYPESHALALRRGSDGAELVSQPQPARPPASWQRAIKVPPWLRA